MDDILTSFVDWIGDLIDIDNSFPSDVDTAPHGDVHFGADPTSNDLNVEPSHYLAQFERIDDNAKYYVPGRGTVYGSSLFEDNNGNVYMSWDDLVNSVNSVSRYDIQRQ